MSYNITFKVTEDGQVEVDYDHSYLLHCPRGVYVVNGHQVPEGEEGYETVGVTAPGRDGRYGMQATAGHRVDR